MKAGMPMVKTCCNGTPGCPHRGEKHVCDLQALPLASIVTRIKLQRVMPAQKPGKSVQIVETPWDLIDAVEGRFGKIEFDLAATADNCKVREGGTINPFKRFGPGSKRGEDALVQDWAGIRGNKWLNPEFGDIKSYAAKCFMTLSEKPKGSIFFLIPASVGSNWWRDYIDKRAMAYFLSPRVTFTTHTSPYPKDLALVHYGGKPGYECWRWKK